MDNDFGLREMDLQNKMMTETMKALTELLKAISTDSKLKFNDKKIDKGMATLLKYAKNGGEIETVMADDTIASQLEQQLKESRIPFGKVALKTDTQDQMDEANDLTTYIYLIRGKGTNEMRENINDRPNVEKIIKEIYAQQQEIKKPEPEIKHDEQKQNSQNENPSDIMRRRKQQRKERMEKAGI
ncbi:hypothetical protein [Butyrivibrio sp. AC2005]|uniref:hypothetical protein n=1 Tax=Butyrivibrio sp. AC2005 TaxID=1280672 RepID=UPI0003F9EAAF|nr:hypothetical protein [Butyrivibrio sp. AC2005]